jgi:hypothetical protein
VQKRGKRHDVFSLQNTNTNRKNIHIMDVETQITQGMLRAIASFFSGAKKTILAFYLYYF